MTDNFTWGFDGWVYACHGFSNTSEVKGADGKPITMQSGNTYRMRPDGSHVEYFTHGQVNPFGLAFDPLGNVYSCDCHSRPLYQLLRGAWYPSFGKPDDGLGFGPQMVTHDHGSTAIAGIVYYAADQFPAAFRDNLFIGNVVTNRINRDRLEWQRLDAEGHRAPRLPHERRPLVPAGRPGARPRRGDLRRRLLQPDHRPLRGPPDAPRPRPRARSDLADRLPGPRRPEADLRARSI